MIDFLPLTIIGVTVAGGLGAVARLIVGGAVQQAARTTFPIGTVIVNVSGSFVLGLVMSSALTSAGPAWIAIAGTGFCGGFTTFSTASVETSDLLFRKKRLTALTYALVTGIASIAAAAWGYSL
jgi:CrcB protein